MLLPSPLGEQPPVWTQAAFAGSVDAQSQGYHNAGVFDGAPVRLHHQQQQPGGVQSIPITTPSCTSVGVQTSLATALLLGKPAAGGGGTHRTTSPPAASDGESTKALQRAREKIDSLQKQIGLFKQTEKALSAALAENANLSAEVAALRNEGLAAQARRHVEVATGGRPSGAASNSGNHLADDKVKASATAAATAHDAVKLHDTIRKQNASIDALKAAASRATDLEAQLSASIADAAKLREANTDLQQRLSASTMAAAGFQTAQAAQAAAASLGIAPAGGLAGGGGLPTLPALRDLQAHKRELLRLEDESDALRRVVHVEKEAEIRSLTTRIERLTRDVAFLESENTSLRVKLSVPQSFATNQPSHQTSVGPSASSSHEQAIAALVERRQHEDRVLELESRVLDLRFERESLQLKVERLQRHVAELLAVIVAGDPNSGHGRSPLTAKSSGNVGAEKQHHLPLSARSEGSPAVSFGLAASGGAPVMIGSSASKAAQLEAVVDSLKLVVDKLHHENVQLKQSGVSSAKFVEASRELKRSREKEREYVEMISQLTAKLTAVEMKAAGRRGGASGSGFSSTSDGAAMGSDLALVQRWKSAQAHAIRLEDELKQVKQQLYTARNVQGTMSLI